MDDTVNFWVSSEHFFEGGLVGDIDLVEIRSLSAEQLDTVEYYFGGVVETVDNDDFVAMLQKC